MSVIDEIKTTIYEQFVGGSVLGTGKILLLLAASVLVGLYIFAVYKNQAKSAFYSKDLNITIAGLPVIVCGILIAMQNNLVISLGMVGALSIVRFRNAVKNPLDLLYFFWAISAGIMCGVGLAALALVLCLVMTALVVLLHFVPGAKCSSIVVLRSSGSADWGAVRELLKKYGKNVKEKSRSYQAGQTEIIYELFTREEDKLIGELEKTEGIEQIHFLAHDGEYRI